MTIFSIVYLLILSYDGRIFHDHHNTKYKHWMTSLATINEVPLIVGSAFMSSDGNKVERYNSTTDTWVDLNNYSFHSQ